MKKEERVDGLTDHLGYFVKDVSEKKDISEIRIFTKPPAEKIGLDDVFYQIELNPITESVKYEGKSLPEDTVKFIEGLKYCVKKKIIVDAVCKVKNSKSILINGDIFVNPEASSESVSLMGAIYFDKETPSEICDIVNKETLKRVKYIMECLDGSTSFLEKLIESGVA